MTAPRCSCTDVPSPFCDVPEHRRPAGTIPRCTCDDPAIVVAECPDLAGDTMGESDGTVCATCAGTGEVFRCETCGTIIGPATAL